MTDSWPVPVDDLGPYRVEFVREPAVGLAGFVVVDNIACGPAIGGIRMAPDVTVTEVARLARAMTLKNAAAGLAHGGGKAGIVGDPAMPARRKEEAIRAFGRALDRLTDYIPGPDMGTDETCMAWVKDETGRAVGLPRVVGGIPLDEIGATGYGLAISAEAAQSYAGIELRGARVAIQGFGAVGRHAARFLAERGAIVIAVADSKGAVAGPGGFDVNELIEFKESGRSVAEYAGGATVSADDMVGIECDVWIPAARPDVLTAHNVDRLRAKLVLQGANIPATPEAEVRMHKRGIVSVPDFIANAGGVICASVEYRGGTEAQAFAAIESLIRRNTAEVLAHARETRETPRAAAEAMAIGRVRDAARYRRFGRSSPAGRGVNPPSSEAATSRARSSRRRSRS